MTNEAPVGSVTDTETQLPLYNMSDLHLCLLRSKRANTIDFVDNISSLLRCRTNKRDQQKRVHRNDKDKEVSIALPS
jgi:hypothetical protein